MNDNFGIRLRVEAMTIPLEFSTEFAEIINFAVEYDPRTAVFVKHRLVTAGKVNNAEAPHSETRTIFNEYTFVIRSAVNDTVAHLAHQIYGDVAFSGCTYNSCNSAHIPCIYPFATTESDSVFLIGVMFLKSLNR